MRTTTALFLALLPLAACDDTSSTANDMAMAMDLVTVDQAIVTSTSCIGHVTKPMPTEKSYTFPFLAVDYLSKAPLAGVTVKVCAESDVMCATPSMTATTDASGMAMVTAPAGPFGVAGYFDLTAMGYVEQIQYTLAIGLNDALKAGATVTAPMFSTSTAGIVYSVLGVTPDATKGFLTFLAFDCKNQPLAGVTGTTGNADANTKTYYVAGSLPSNTATMTDASGGALILGVPPGSTKLLATFMSSLYSQIDIVVRPGVATALNAFPTM